MYIDCDTCTARGTGCGDCVVTVLLGAPPGWQSDPTVVPMAGRRDDEPAAEDVVVPRPGVVVEFDDVERRAVRALAEGGLVPPLRHQPVACPPARTEGAERRAGGQGARRRTG
ncbi:MAG: hypothetical protein M3Q47_01000 [Actinomycetota bacterium]|nr:hypothetical protein [Actinomycetota bacterium]